ncbi:hypothetical protein R0K17_08075 [Planococcus sp. SIMBA_143]
MADELSAFIKIVGRQGGLQLNVREALNNRLKLSMCMVLILDSLLK